MSMELNTFGAPSVRLLSADESGSICNTDAEATGAAVEHVMVEGSTSCDTAVAVALGFCVLSASAVMFYLVVDIWQSQSYYRAWILMAFTAPLSFAAGSSMSLNRFVSIAVLLNLCALRVQ